MWNSLEKIKQEDGFLASQGPTQPWVRDSALQSIVSRLRLLYRALCHEQQCIDAREHYQHTNKHTFWTNKLQNDWIWVNELKQSLLVLIRQGITIKNDGWSLVWFPIPTDKYIFPKWVVTLRTTEIIMFNLFL